MDPGVIEAMRRWPNVPAVYGWLSLTPRGEWRLHPLGDASRGGMGEGISNEQILAFITRNYVGGQDGCWFFQNGPQRVFVRIDAAPLILRVNPIEGQLTTHCGHPIQHVRHWWMDELGRLFAQTDRGPAMVDDRDLMLLCEVLRSVDGLSLIDLLESLSSFAERPPVETVNDCPVNGEPHGAQSTNRDASACHLVASGLFDPTGLYHALSQPAPLQRVDANQVPACLGFEANPSPRTTHDTSQALE